MGNGLYQTTTRYCSSNGRTKLSCVSTKATQRSAHLAIRSHRSRSAGSSLSAARCASLWARARVKSRIGLDNDGYKELWDADHPDDPLEV